MARNRLNRVLSRTFGYELRKVNRRPTGRKRPAAAAGPRPATPPKAGPGEAGRKAAAKPTSSSARSTSKRAANQGIPAHFDDSGKAILRRVRPRTMTGWPKLYALVLATRYVIRYDVPGDIVECGVWRGGSMQAVSLTLQEVGGTDRHLHLFDTFEGMPPPGEHDERFDGSAAADLLATSDRDRAVWAVADLDDVQAGMREVGQRADRVSYHPGLVEDTIPSQAPEHIALLRLDTDWYESTRHELEHLYDRLSPGGVLIIDDYGHWEGARKATEEFLDRTGSPLLLLPIGSGRIAVKPWA